MKRSTVALSFAATWMAFAFQAYAKSGVANAESALARVGLNVHQLTSAWLTFSDFLGPAILAVVGTGIIILVLRRGDDLIASRWFAVYNAVLAIYLAVSFLACTMPLRMIVNVP
jgi:hypothetical protein